MPDLAYSGLHFSKWIAEGFGVLTPVFHNDICRVLSFRYSRYRVETGYTEWGYIVSPIALRKARSDNFIWMEIEVDTFCFRLWHSVHESNARFLFPMRFGSVSPPLDAI